MLLTHQKYAHHVEQIKFGVNQPKLVVHAMFLLPAVLHAKYPRLHLLQKPMTLHHNQ